jgi:3-ketoacyl-CoA synthase
MAKRKILEIYIDQGMAKRLMHQNPCRKVHVPANLTFEEAKKEAEMIMFRAINQLLAKTKVNVKDIVTLVLNCSLFNPTPSLSAMVINRYKLRGNVLSYSLGGMGCSARVISIDLAKCLLQSNSLVHHKHFAAVTGTDQRD